MTWDTLDTTATIGGGAAGNVSATVSYEDAGKTLVIDVLTDFTPNEWIAVSGLSFASFTAASPADNLELELRNDGLVSAVDDKTIRILPGAPSSCYPLSVTGAGNAYTVTAPSSFEMRFDKTTGGGIDQFFDLAEDPGRINDLAGGMSLTKALFTDEIQSGGILYNTDQNTLGPKLDLLEATPTRVRLRQEAFYQEEGATSILAGLKGIGDYSIPPGADGPAVEPPVDEPGELHRPLPESRRAPGRGATRHLDLVQREPWSGAQLGPGRFLAPSERRGRGENRFPPDAL